MSNTTRQTGIVKFFKKETGWGFITPTNGTGDVFVHSTAVTGGKLKEGDNVEFEIGTGKKGECAVKVEVV